MPCIVRLETWYLVRCCLVVRKSPCRKACKKNISEFSNTSTVESCYKEHCKGKLWDTIKQYKRPQFLPKTSESTKADSVFDMQSGLAIMTMLTNSKNIALRNRKPCCIFPFALQNDSRVRLTSKM